MLLAHPRVAEELAGLEIPRQDTAPQVLRQDVHGADGDGFGTGLDILDLLHGPVVDGVAGARHRRGSRGNRP